MAIQAHVEWLKEGVSRWNKRRKKIDFSPDLSGANFFELLPPDFRDQPKTSRTFEKIDLSKSDLRGANLSHLNFRKGKFDHAQLQDADLSLSNFDEAKFKSADLSGAIAPNSTFDGAVFENVAVSEIYLQDADLSNAIFVAANISNTDKERLEAEGAQFFESKRSYQDFRTYEAVEGHSLGTSDENVAFKQFQAISTATHKNRYDVFFGTNRKRVIERGALTGFNSARSQSINYGLCEVIVPEGHRVGSLGSPLWKRLWNRKDDRLRIDSLIALNEELFFRHLKITAAKMKIAQRPTLFVHGFNNSFEAAVLRAAQIGYDLGIGQGVGLFSWPSSGKKRAYSADEAAAESSKYLLADFIEKFIHHSPASSVNVIAHSMGCRCLLGALEVLSNGRKSALKKVNQVILAAADVDTSIMPNVAAAAAKYSTRTTSYVSDHDKALKLSGWLHDYPRVGFVPPTFIMSGVDTVLVNDDDLGTLSHGYIGSSRTVLNDIYNLLSKNEDPSSRFSVETIQAGHWRIRN
ncbi:alpha/beta hydrolase [Sulfitobacter mediterraneus]|uniref:alpha/beta hydrolase n=1 Tax=Sulfitobacter mediterraneus TaxID=83219 RepID=UPI000EA19E68|nr:alpha/beta hydrolase [Sulfitobacter mediterraneus]